ncbi:hypothetical protein D3C81_1792990 [compost metagenome]
MNASGAEHIRRHPRRFTCHRGSFLGEMIPQLRDQMHRRQRFAGACRGAYIGTAAAFNASVEVEHLLLREVLDVANAKAFRFFVFEV